jgi:opacity protein-like surface antigen
MSMSALVAVALAAGEPSVTGPSVGYQHAPEALVLPLNIGVAQAESTPAFGAPDSWRWNIWGGYGNDFDDAQQGLVAGGVSWFFVENLSLDLELGVMGVDQEENDVLGGNFNLLFRWHFLARENWSLYADLGAGILITSNDVPDNGSSFNFTPQAGVGASFEVAHNVRVMTGVRWHHISNARTYHENPGRDSLMLYAGVSLPF